jgi:hypothetical protein
MCFIHDQNLSVPLCLCGSVFLAFNNGHQMAEAKPTPDAEQLAKQLQSSLAQRRPRPWKLLLGLIAVCALLLAAMVFWWYPRGRSAPLQIMAFDGVFAADATPTARAQLLPPPGAETPPRLSGFDIDFHEQVFPIPAKEQAKPRSVVARSDAKGQAAVEWIVANAPVAEFFVRYRDPDQKHISAAERGRLFVWPKDAPILIVDAEQTLIADELDAEAQAKLSEAAEAGWHIIYLAVAGDTPLEFRTASGWLERQVQLPKGPILGRPDYDESLSADAARRALVKKLQSQFRGPLQAIVKSAEAAQACNEAGVRTVLIGAAAHPADVLKVASWADVPLKLK